MDGFTNLKLRTTNLHQYFHRFSILKFITDRELLIKGKIIDVGCGRMPYKSILLSLPEVESYLGLDLHTALPYAEHVIPDITWDGKEMPLETDTFDVALVTEVLEHCFEPEYVLRETFRVLKPGGVILITVPFIWNLHEVPNDYFRYTPFALKKLLKNSKFNEIKIEPLGGWHASLAQMLGLWVKHAPLNKGFRFICKRFFWPIVYLLIRIDKIADRNSTRPLMMTGLAAVAYKRQS